ncbi:phosphotransferase [Rhizomicrobium electricum]|uniref:phosphotransferase n=1 Tax=Rhizomicrobium electricum TaxID=480070 RepID=UPI001424245F|nr:hypothetical protein [Rhizomicrobium electricum]
MAFGNPEYLAQNIVFLSGLRGFIERAAIDLTQKLDLGRSVKESPVLYGWSQLVRQFQPRDAFLLYTGYYKDTILVGGVTCANGASLFVKVYDDPAKAAAELVRANCAERFLRPWFKPACLQAADGCVVGYELLIHAKRTPLSTDVETAILSLCRSAYNSPRGSRPTADFVDPLLSTRLSSINVSELGATLERLLSEQTPTPEVRCHGDLTSWNLFLDNAGALCLVDYEHVGVCSPYADFFHYYVQPAALHCKTVDLEGLVTLSARSAGVHKEEARRWLALYLAQQLNRDAFEWVDRNRRHRQLARLIENKAAFLMRVSAEV